MKKTELIKFFLEYGFNVSPDALEYALDWLSKKKISKEVLKNNIASVRKEITVINLEIIKEYLESIDESTIQLSENNKAISTTDQLKSDINDVKRSDNIIEPIMKNFDLHRATPNLTIQLDIPEKTIQKPELDAFRKLFQNRFIKLSRILKERLGSPETLLKRNLSMNEVPNNRSGIVIGMVQETRVLHTNKFVIQLEDPENEITTNCVMVQDSTSFPEYRNIIRDTVIGISGVLPKDYREGAITAFWGRDIIRPSFVPIEFRPTQNAHKILFLADFHYGSKFFSRSTFAKLIKFLTLINLKPNTENIASQIDMIFILGDLIDGVGRFSNQKDKILFHSLRAQYSGLAKLIAEIPSSIEIIIIPGEHDATQVALPQPAIDKKSAQDLLALSNVKSHGNPLRLSIDETKILIFHGQGNDTLFRKNVKSKLFNPILGMQNILEYRHICPEYGSSIPLAPFNKDYLVINDIPNIFVIGHFHKAQFQEYKGVKLISCGTFQQRQHETELSPEEEVSLGVFPILDTANGSVELFDLRSI
ncbi:MAG: metallophosphoesterase [Candidatus Hodarchaeota archaeon]